MTKKVAVIALLSLAAGSLTLAAATPKRIQQLKAAKEKAAKGRVKAMRLTDATRVVGTVVYDTGAPNAGFHPGPQNNAGNRFNSDMGAPLLMTGQLTMITFFPNASFGYVTAFGPPTAGGNCSNLGSFGVSGAVPSAFNVVNVGNIPVGPDFLAGAWELHPTLRQGMDNMSVAPQGFHAFSLTTNFPGSGTNFFVIPGQNALVRATGNILVPVELMNFQVQ